MINYIITCVSGCEALVSGEDKDDAVAAWMRDVERGDAEDMASIRRADAEDVAYAIAQGNDFR